MVHGGPDYETGFTEDAVMKPPVVHDHPPEASSRLPCIEVSPDKDKERAPWQAAIRKARSDDR